MQRNLVYYVLLALHGGVRREFNDNDRESSIVSSDSRDVLLVGTRGRVLSGSSFYVRKDVLNGTLSSAFVPVDEVKWFRRRGWRR